MLAPIKVILVTFLSLPDNDAVLFSLIVTVLLLPVTTKSISAVPLAAAVPTLIVVVLLLPVKACIILLLAAAEFDPTVTVEVLLLPVCQRVNSCVAPITYAAIILLLPI